MARFLVAFVFVTLFHEAFAVRRSGVIDQAGREAYNLLDILNGPGEPLQ